MPRMKLKALFVGIAVVASMFAVASPASAEAGRLFNAGPDTNGYCLATHEPYVFAFSRCLSESYIDQRWDVVNWGNGYQIRSLYYGGCLTARADGSVYTYPSPCESYADQRWRPYQGQWGMWENVHHAGRCLAAHSNGYVFIAPCNLNYSDQYWYISN